MSLDATRDRATAKPDASARRHATLSPAALLALLCEGDALSGSALASTLGISRAAIWKQIEQLRALGLPIAATAGQGYRLEAPVDLLDAALMETAVAPEQRARIGAIDLFWQIDSTSSELLRRAANDPAPRACLAEIQTRGRGRRGRAWRMPLAGGIALSMLRPFESGMAALAGLSLVAGIAVVRALADEGIDRAALKWPNDIVVDGKKLGGILVELGGDALGPCHAVIGVGINVRLGAQAGAAIDQPWIDLATLAPDRALLRNRLAGRILSRLAEALDSFAACGFAPFAAEYERCDALRGRLVTVSGTGDAWNGTAGGVTPRGALKVMRDGSEVHVDSGEVSVRAQREALDNDALS